MKPVLSKAILALALLSAAFCRCHFNNDFTQPEIVSVTPADRSFGVDADTFVTVIFSEPMDTLKTTNEFSLDSEAGKVEGRFIWSPDGKRLDFQPAHKLLESTLYRISISSAAEDINGNDLRRTHSSVFSVSSDLLPPVLIAFTPSNDTCVPPDSTISLVFSEPIDLDSLYGGISISPPIEGRFSWDASHSIIAFTPLYPMPYGSTYAITINSDIRDRSGNRLAKEAFFNFTVGGDFIRPTLQVSQPPSSEIWSEDCENHGVEKDGGILILFSEEVSSIGLHEAVTISPPVSFYVDTSPGRTMAHIKFIEPLESEAHYTLRISTAITDLQNNPLAKEYRFHFLTNGPGSIAPKVLSITDPKIPGGWALGETQPLAFELSPSGGTWYPGIRIRFSTRMDPTSLGITADRVVGTGTTPRVSAPDWPDESPYPRFSIYRFDLAGAMPGNIYKITIKGRAGGLRDLNGNCMKEDFVQYVRF